ncbi:hypothetical protein PIB30_051814 [Stylosanthes scabra]|uniref:TIR domain-containing protein n=1 Tax=Stylosanthes scabra TaxID=79078 RepID=A0ABU6VGY5_9FABA|nr:hypothetical protein [Stylosanthes scabra]
MAKSCGVCHKRHDVFISFRGGDTRTDFTSHLHAALTKRGIETYIDYRLRSGDDIWESLCKAIQESHISIVVFSKDYASSRWCLKELVQIMKCRREQGQLVIPVFCKTDPSQIRDHSESCENLIKENDELEVHRWMDALTEAADLSPSYSQSSANRDESLLIKDVVKHVMQKLLKLRYSSIIKGLVAIDEARKGIELLMKNARRIGIWGMGGIGKTTIAKVMFTILSPHYDSVCFLKNISEESKHNELAYLRNKLSELLKEIKLVHKVVGTTHTTGRMNSNKVLIVLDDVDTPEQLDYLCGESEVINNLPEDSRVIITTRNRRLLISKVDEIYEVRTLDPKESLKLFSLKAFRESHPKEGYEQLSRQVVEYAGGIPFALNVLGSYLHSRSIQFWESTLRKLKKSPYVEIQDMLRVSYDGLEPLEQKIFLDIAFFFKDEKKDLAIRILDACGFEASSGIGVLKDKALITISSYDDRIQMHDLLREMATEIVRRESGSEPGGRSRLMDVKDIRKVLENNTGTNAVEGIILDLSRIKDLHLSSDIFGKMNNIRFLKFYIPKGESSSSKCLSKGLEQFPKELRYLEWDRYPLKSFPPTFCSELLVEIHMHHSDVEELWQGMDAKDLNNLEVIDLSECRKLANIPDLSNASRLKWVNLSGCEKLCYLHPSVLSSGMLVTLILDRCKNLTQVKCEKRLESLKKISVNGCSSLKEFEVWSNSIKTLDLSKTAIETLHTSIGNLNNLRSLNLKSLRLEHLPNDLAGLKFLEYLNLSCNGLELHKDQLHVLFNGLQSLEILHLEDCSKLLELPDNISALSELHELRLDGSSIIALPASIKNLQKLETLSLENCNQLRSLPELPPSIKELYADNCSSLVSVSNLKNLATKMIGQGKYISFKDSFKLGNYSLYSIMESLWLTMMSAAFHNVLVKAFDMNVHSYNYNSVWACLPGSSIPRHFTNRTTGSSITVRFPNPASGLGVILCVVLSPSFGVKKFDAKIQCQCYNADGTHIGNDSGWYYYEDIPNLNSDTVFLWYDPYFSFSILRTHEQQVSFNFITCATDGDGMVVTKGCGVRLICHSELDSVLGEMELEYEKKVELGMKLGLALDMKLIEPKPGIHNLFFELDYGCVLEPSMKFELDLRRRAVAAVIEEQRQKYSEFIFPPRLTRMWKICSPGLQNALFP